MISATINWPAKTSSSSNLPLKKLKLLFLVRLPFSTGIPLEIYMRNPWEAAVTIFCSHSIISVTLWYTLELHKVNGMCCYQFNSPFLPWLLKKKMPSLKNLPALVLRVGDENLTLFFASYLNASWSLQVGMGELPLVIVVWYFQLQVFGYNVARLHQGPDFLLPHSALGMRTKTSIL